MDRALSRFLLRAASGELENLPSPVELQALLADAELSLLDGGLSIDADAVRTGWLLLGVGCAANRLDWADRISSFRVAGHVLDLAARDETGSVESRLDAAFGSQVAYRRGDLEPNAVAVLRRCEPLFELQHQAGPEHDWWPGIALECASRTLSLNTYRTYAWIRERRQGFDRLRGRTFTDDLDGTIFGPAVAIVEGCAALLRVLLFNDADAEVLFDESLRSVSEHSAAGLQEKWIAAQVLMAGREMIAASTWRTLAGQVPHEAIQALTTASPPILTLWPPQRALLHVQHPANPLNSDVRRSVISIPTSAGKTLVAQIIVLAELASTATPVCFVAPQRSLVKEIRRGLMPRVRALRRGLGREAADFDDELGTAVTVDVMTPERFARMLRADPSALLGRYGLFVFDEVHLVGDKSRGFGLEGSISYLHHLTREAHHRIVVMSAGIGNVGAFRSWLDADDAGLTATATWRAPRRLTAAFTTKPRWNEATHRPPLGRERKHRLLYPLDGRVAFSIPGAGLREGTIRDIGTLAFGRNESGGRGKRDGPFSTGHYDHVAQLAVGVASAGPVLSVTGTRPNARGLAQRISELKDEEGHNAELQESLISQLGEDHPLPGMVIRGVAYHHAGLPEEVLAQLEDAVRAGQLEHLVCTTTLTEGVNLPVHTVIVAELRFSGSDVVITGPRMLNALGRAGRAGMENEGWVVFAMTGESSGDPAEHLPSLDDLEVRSHLAADDFLEELEAWSSWRTSTADAVFGTDLPEVLEDFTRFVWYVAACQEALTASFDVPALEAVLDSTLGAAQQTAAANTLTRRFLADVVDEYSTSDPIRRRVWGRDGTRIRTGREIDRIATLLTEGDAPLQPRSSAPDALSLLDESGALGLILDLPEARGKWGFRVSPRGAPIEVDTAAMLLDWIAAADLAEIAESHLSDIPDREFRIEALVDRISGTFGHALPWLLSALNERVNDEQVLGLFAPLCPSLPKFVRYGVASDDAVRLVERGIRSRTLASQLATTAHEQAIVGDGLVAWLAAQPLQTWGEDTLVADLRDLAEVIGSNDATRLPSILEGEPVAVQVFGGPYPPVEGRVEISEMRPGFEVAELILGDARSVSLGAADQLDLVTILRTGVELGVSLAGSSAVLTLKR